MANESGRIGNRERGREMALEGILRSRFGERPCAAAERALQAIRSADASTDSPEARTATRPSEDGGPRRRSNGRRRFAPSAGRRWPAWIKTGLATAAALLLLLAVRLAFRERTPGTGGRLASGTERVVRLPEPADRGERDAPVSGSPPEKGVISPAPADPGAELVRELAWTENFDAGGSSGRSRGGSRSIRRSDAFGAPQPPGGTPTADLAAGSARQGEETIGRSAVFKDKAVDPIGKAVDRASPVADSRPVAGSGADDLRARIEACVGGLSFRVRIPEELPDGYRLAELVSKATGDGVLLRYVRDAAVARVFVSPSAGPDTPVRKVQRDSRILLAARQRGLLIAIEDGPTDPAACEAWVNRFVTP